MTDSLHFDSTYWIPNPCQCNLDSRFPAFTGFRVLEETVSHSKSKKFQDSGIQITWHGLKCEVWRFSEALRGGGGTPLYIDMYRPRVFAPLWSENEYRLCSFWSGIGCGFQGNYVNVRRYLPFQFQTCKKEREIGEYEIDFRKSFLLLL